MSSAAPTKPRSVNRTATWATTPQLLEELGISRRTLQRLIQGGMFKPKVHWRPTNPLVHRSPRLWHRQRVAKLLWKTDG